MEACNNNCPTLYSALLHPPVNAKCMLRCGFPECCVAQARRAPAALTQLPPGGVVPAQAVRRERRPLEALRMSAGCAMHSCTTLVSSGVGRESRPGAGGGALASACSDVAVVVWKGSDFAVRAEWRAPTKCLCNIRQSSTRVLWAKTLCKPVWREAFKSRRSWP